jgi:hypothetical protein
VKLTFKAKAFGLIAATVVSALLIPGHSATAAPVFRGEKLTHAGPLRTPPIRRHGTLRLLGNGTAYDLDSLAKNWDASIGVPWVAQNIMYAPFGNNGKPILDIAFAPATDVLMGKGGHWNYRSCATAHYDPSYVKNPNVATGKALNVGHGICIITRNTKHPRKTDGGHYVLLVIKSITNTALTVQVTVWK